MDSGRISGSARLVFLIAFLVFALAFLLISHNRSVRNLLNVKVVRIAPGPDVEIRPALAKEGGETFARMMERLRPYAAINGTYYDTDMKPLGDILIDGRLVSRGHYRSALAIRSDGSVEIVRLRIYYRRWGDYRAGLAAGPRLVSNGKVDLNPEADGFSRKSLTLKAWRSGAGITADGTLLLVTVKEAVTLSEFARIMLDLGAVDALNLDGGGACGLYHNGNLLASPPLPMTNALLVYKKG